jgi:hypothetical protein
VELTHYEAASEGMLKYDEECRTFAQKAAKSTNPVAELSTKVRENILKVKMLSTEEEQVRSLMPVAAKTWGYVHYLTQEFLKQESSYNFSNLSVGTPFTDVVSATLPGTSPEQHAVNAHMHYHMAMHKLGGRVVWDVTPGLAAQLRNTELRGLTADDLVMPVRSIYLMVPPEANLRVWNSESGWHRLIGIYVTEDTHSGVRGWRFLACGESKPIEVYKGLYDNNDALVYFSVPLAKGTLLVDTVARLQDVIEKEERELRHKFDNMHEEWKNIFHWAMNAVLYCSMPGAEKESVIANPEAKRLLEQAQALPKGSKKRSRISKQLSTIPQCRRVILGRSVVQRGSWQLTVRILVSGHWRHQPYGPGSALRRLQWIEPYWKGKDDDTEGGTDARRSGEGPNVDGGMVTTASQSNNPPSPSGGVQQDNANRA